MMFTEFVIFPILILLSLWLLVASLTFVTKIFLSEKVKYADIGIVENKEFRVDTIADSEGGNYKHERYYVTVSYKDHSKTFDNPRFYSSVQAGEEIDIYIVEFWFKKELYRLDFHYIESFAGEFWDY